MISLLNYMLETAPDRMWKCEYVPKDKKPEKLVDNYDKTAHMLNISYDGFWKERVGYCSLCGHRMRTTSKRCPFCRASIEEDSYA